MVRASRPLTTVAVLILVAACSGDPQASGAPSSATSGSNAPGNPSTWEPENAWQRALGTIGEDGQFSLQASLDLFATAFGPVPGSTRTQDVTGISDLTIAVNAVRAHEDELTAEQRAAIDKYLEVPPGATTITVGKTAGNAARGVQLVEFTEQRRAQLLGMAQGFRDKLELRLGIDLPLFDIVFIDRPPSVQPVGHGLFPSARADGAYLPDETFNRCVITVYNEASSQNDTELASVLAHEIFHCFQYRWFTTYDAFAAVKPWIIEGQAAWAGEVLGGITDKYAPFWNDYLLQPTKSLITRTYDAIGFYSHLQRRHELAGHSGEDAVGLMWAPLKAMWVAGPNDAAAFANSGAESHEFLDSWASSVTRDAGRGEAWDASGPGITTSAYVGPLVDVSAAAGPVNVGEAAFTNEVRKLSLKADLVHFAIGGNHRLNDGATDTIDLHDVWYCVAGHTCEPNAACPDAFPLPDTAGTINDFALLSITGGTGGTTGTVTGMDVPDTCESLPPLSSFNPLAKATVTFGYGVAQPMRGGWCKVGTDPSGVSYFNLWFVGPGKDAFDIAIESATPIKAGYYVDAPDAMGVERHTTSTIRQGSFYFNLKLGVVILEGTTESGSFVPTGGSFSGTYHDGDRGDQYISGRFDCFGDETDFDWATGAMRLVGSRGGATILQFSANSDADGADPSGYVTLTTEDKPSLHLQWAEVKCLNVTGEAFGLVAWTNRAQNEFETKGLPQEMQLPVSTYFYLGGRRDAASADRDPTVFRVASDAGTCAPNLYAPDYQESVVLTHDAP